MFYKVIDKYNEAEFIDECAARLFAKRRVLKYHLIVSVYKCEDGCDDCEIAKYYYIG